MAKVLLVEDDNNLREIYQARLMAEGYDIVAAQNGEEALVVAKQNKPDLIVSDVMMPRISGFEMLDILRNTDELKHTKVIMLTALGQSEDQKRADNLGADKYLVKSQVTLEDIVNAAKELLSADGVIADVPPAPAAADPLADTTPSVVAPAAPGIPAEDHEPLVVPPGLATPPAAAAPATTPVEPAAPITPVAPAPATEATPTPPAATPAPVVTPAPLPPAPVALPTPVSAAVPVASEPTPETPAPNATATPVASPVPAEPAVEPATPTPVAAEPVATPASEPSAAPAPVAPAPATVVTPDAVTAATPTAPAAAAEAQTLAAEEAALEAQIAGYADAPAQTPLTVEPTAAEPEASNDAALAEAVEALNNPAAPATPAAASATPVAPAPAIEATPTPPAATPAPVVTPAPLPPAPATPAGATAPTPTTVSPTSAGGTKVIQPLNDSAAKPDINELLAREEAKTPTAAAPAAAPVVNGAAGQPPVAAPAHAPGQSFDPANPANLTL